MKKNLIALFAAALFVLINSCGMGEKTPSQVAEEGCKCLQKGDYEAYVELFYFNDTISDSKKAETKAMFKSILQEKMSAELKEKQGIKDFKIVKEDVVNDSVAKVTMEINYNNGKKENETTTLKKNKDGKWGIDSGK